VARATPCPKNGVTGPPHFWPRGGRPPYTGRMGVAEATPRPLVVVRPPRKAKKKKKKNEKMGLGFWVAEATPRPLGVVRPLPKFQTHFFIFFFFFGGLSGWPDHPQRPRVASATPIRPVWGGRSHPLAKNGVVRPPHFWARGGSSHPTIPPPPLFFFNFLLFKKKKKKEKLKPKMPKTTLFWATSFWASPKRRSF
jgi:hypothetical protein